MKTFILIFSIILIISYVLLKGAISVYGLSYEDYKKDFLTVINKIENAAPDPFLYDNRNAYESVKQNITDNLHNCHSSLEFYRMLLPLMASLRNLHYSIRLNDEQENRLENKHSIFPFSVIVDTGRLLINEDLRNVSSIKYKGKEIKSINGKTVNDIFSALQLGVKYDSIGLHFFESRIEHSFGVDLLHVMNIKDSFDVDIDGSHEKVKGIKKAMFSSNDTSNISTRIINNERGVKVGYLKILSLENRYKDYFGELLSNFFTELKQSNINNLIIDIRDNIGGSTKLARALFEYISSSGYSFGSSVYFDNGKLITDSSTITFPGTVSNKFHGHVVLLKNERTFSSAHMLSAAFQFYKMGKTVGVPGLEKTTMLGEVEETILEKTKLVFRYPTAKFFLPQALGKEHPGDYLMPDYYIRRSTEEKLRKSDSQLAFALGLMK